MWIAIAIVATVFIGLTIYIVASKELFNTVWYIAWAMLAIVTILLGQAIHIPPNTNFYLDTGIDRIYFSSYTIKIQDDEIILSVPDHYYIKREWLNTPEYCDIPLTILFTISDPPNIVKRYSEGYPKVISGSLNCR